MRLRFGRVTSLGLRAESAAAAVFVLLTLSTCGSPPANNAPVGQAAAPSIPLTAAPNAQVVNAEHVSLQVTEHRAFNGCTGAMYHIVRVVVVNNGSKEAFITPLLFQAVTTQGRVIPQGSSGAPGVAALAAVTLAKDQSVEGAVLFDTLDGATLATVTMKPFGFAERVSAAIPVPLGCAVVTAPTAAIVTPPPLSVTAPQTAPTKSLAQPTPVGGATFTLTVVDGPGTAEYTGTNYADRIVTTEPCQRLTVRYDFSSQGSSSAGTSFVVSVGTVYTSDGKVWTRNAQQEGPLPFSVQRGEFVILHNSKNGLAAANCVG